MLRKAAMELEEKHRAKKALRAETRKFCTNPTSTYGDSSAVPPPLTVVGRIRQQLQCSETLIYDNKINSIIKFMNTNPTKGTPSQQSLPSLLTLQATSVHSLHLPEEPPPMWPQLALFREPPWRYPTLMITLKSGQPSRLQSPRTSPSQSPRSLPKPAAIEETLLESQVTKIGALTAPRDEAIKKLLDVARKLNEDSFIAVRKLHRSNTSPALSLVIVEKGKAADELPSLLWKRYNSYPPYLPKRYPATPTPTPPNLRSSLGLPGQGISKPSLPGNANSSNKNNYKKLPTRQRVLPEDLPSCTPSKTRSQTFNGSQHKNDGVGSSSRTTKRAPRASSTVCYKAHATSHAKTGGTNSDNGTPMSSTQRRLSYNPRATLNRTTTWKRTTSATSSNSLAPVPSSTAGQSSQTFPRSTSSVPCSTSERIRRKMLEQMEQQQRLRYKQLISQQVEEQQRLQEDFKAQQQLLLDQLSGSNYGLIEGSEDPDQAYSDTSSLNSLPRTPFDRDMDKPK